MPEEDVVKRIMPHNLEAEMSVVGAMLMDQQAIGSVMELLTPDDFYSSTGLCTSPFWSWSKAEWRSIRLHFRRS